MIEVKGSSEVIPENDLQELWMLAGKVGSLHEYIKNDVESNMRSEYYKNRDPLDSDMRQVCIIMGFTDLLAMKKSEVEGG